VFSHIKKTYRVQWVLLEGGGSEPPLLASKELAVKGSAKGKRKAGATEKQATAPESQERLVAVKWIPLDENTEANLCSTAMLKVWHQAKSIWAGKSLG